MAAGDLDGMRLGGAAAKKDGFLKDKFWRLATKRKRKGPAVLAVAHTPLVLVYGVLRDKEPYQDRGMPVLNDKQRARIIRHHVRRLGKLGIKVLTGLARESSRNHRSPEAAD